MRENILKNNRKKAFLQCFLTIITIFIVNFICVLIFPIISHAENSFFPQGQNDNNIFNQTIINYLDNNLDPTNNYTFAQIYSRSTNYYRMIAVTVPKENAKIYGEILSNNYQYQLYYENISSTLTDQQVAATINVRVYEIKKSDNTVILQSQNGALSVFGTLTSSLYNNSNSYISNFRLYSSNNTETRQVVLSYGAGEEEPIEEGHATHPHFDGLHPHYGNTVNKPDEVPPTYTINNYSWTTYNNPSVDNSSTDALLESIFDILSYNAGYLQTNISNEFDNLIFNIKGLFDYTGETLQYYGDLIIANIQNGIQNFYDNMVSLVEPIHDKISSLQEKIDQFADLFITPFDEEEFEEQIENSSFFTNYNAIIDNCEEISEIFDFAEERDHFSLYISFENPFADSEHKIISSEINFDWLVPLRSVYRPFIWACVLFDLFVGGAKVLSRIIGGHGLGQ